MVIAQILMDSGDYQGAYDILINLNGYKNSEELLEEVERSKKDMAKHLNK